jgi:N6-adenosine-specific RNA methylase IME4
MRFGTLAVDPPWPYRDSGVPQAGVDEQYPTVSLEDLARLPVRDLAAPTAHLYLWFTNSFAAEAHALAARWGFRPVTILTWGKTSASGKLRMGTGHYYRNCTEHVLFCVRGMAPLVTRKQLTLTLAPIGRHSAKPDLFYETWRKESPGPHLEMFARKYRPGWKVWGNEVESDVHFEWRAA